MTQPLSHDAAIQALCDCAATVSVLSYQEVVEGYFKLRDMPVPTNTPAPEEAVRDARHALELLDDVDSLVRFCSVSMLDVERYNRGSHSFWAVCHWIADNKDKFAAPEVAEPDCEVCGYPKSAHWPPALGTCPHKRDRSYRPKTSEEPK